MSPSFHDRLQTLSSKEQARKAILQLAQGLNTKAQSAQLRNDFTTESTEDTEKEFHHKEDLKNKFFLIFFSQKLKTKANSITSPIETASLSSLCSLW